MILINKTTRMNAYGLAVSAIMALVPAQAHAGLFDTTIPGTKMTLQQCFELAEKQSLPLQVGRKSVERAKAMEGTAWDVDKTEVAFSQNPASSGDTDNALSLSQGIEFPIVYTARRRQLKAETQAERSRLGVTRQQLRQEIASAYYAMLYETHKLSILQRQDSVLDRYSEIAGKRYQAGEARQLEKLAAERMHEENHLEMANAKNAAENQQLMLMSLLNTDQPLVPTDSYLFAIANDAEGEPAHLQLANGQYNYLQTADGQYQQDRLSALDKEVKCAKTGYAPSLSLMLRTQALISSWDPYHIDRQRFTEGNFFGFEIGVGVPLFYGATKAKVKAAKKDREVAELEMMQERREKERDYRIGCSRLQNAAKHLEYYTGKNRQKQKEIIRLSSTEYENGEISYVEYIGALQEAIEVQLKYAEVVNEYNEAVIALMGLADKL